MSLVTNESSDKTITLLLSYFNNLLIDQEKRLILFQNIALINEL